MRCRFPLFAAKLEQNYEGGGIFPSISVSRYLKAISNSRLRHVTKINKQLRYVTGTPTICLRSRKVQQILCSILKNKFFKWDEMEALVQWLLVIPQKMSVTIASLQTQDSRRFGYWLAKEKMKLM